MRHSQGLSFVHVIVMLALCVGFLVDRRSPWSVALVRDKRLTFFIARD